jgi:hypothetical protein
MTTDPKPVSRKTSAHRLLKLADFLDKLPRRKFDYRLYGEKTKCGTVACALGWATQMPEFRRLGLKAKWVKDCWAEFRLIPVFYGEMGPGAACPVFGLTEDEAWFLFMPAATLTADGDRSPGGNATPKQVAKHIRRFVKEHRS